MMFRNLPWRELSESPSSQLSRERRDSRSQQNSRRQENGRRQQNRQSTLELLEPKIVLAANVVASYAVTQNWGTGFKAQIKLTSQQTTAISNWSLGFDYGAQITQIWDGKIVSHTGTHYVISGAGWNNNLAAEGTVSFGFVATPSASPTSPTNYTLNGQSLGGGGSTPPALPSLTVADISLSEGASGSKNAVFTVTMSAASTS